MSAPVRVADVRQQSRCWQCGHMQTGHVRVTDLGSARRWQCTVCGVGWTAMPEPVPAGRS